MLIHKTIKIKIKKIIITIVKIIELIILNDIYDSGYNFISLLNRNLINNLYFISNFYN